MYEETTAEWRMMTSVTGDEDVTDGSVDYYDFDWGEQVSHREGTIFSGCRTDESDDPICPDPDPQCSCGDTSQVQTAQTDDYTIVDL